MSTIEDIPKDYGSEIIGYTEPWIANPGQTVAVKVSKDKGSSPHP